MVGVRSSVLPFVFRSQGRLIVRRMLVSSGVVAALVVGAGLVPAPGLVTPAAVAGESGASQDVPGVPDLPIRTIPATPDPADHSSVLPDTVADLPDDSEATTDLGTSWSPVPGMPVSVRADADTATGSPPASARSSAALSSSDVGSSDGAPDAVDVTLSSADRAADAVAVLTFSDATQDAPPTDPTTPPSPTGSPSPSPTAGPTVAASPSPARETSRTPAPSSPATSSPAPTDPPSPFGGPTDPPPSAGAPVGGLDVKVSYAAYNQVFGGGWSDRLQVIAYPDCYLTTPDDDACSTGTPVASVDDPTHKTLTFTTLPATDATTTPAGRSAAVSTGSGSARSAAFVNTAATTGGATSYAVTAATGAFGQIPVSPSSSWQVGDGSGDFSWSYPFTATDVMRTGAPDLGLSYSSGSVDSMSVVTNGQASGVGIGWADLVPGTITRTYASCADDGLPNKGDLCWLTKGGNVVQGLSLTLNGRSGMLVQEASAKHPDQYRLLDDPNWKITDIHDVAASINNEAPDNADNNNEAFKVSTPDGSTYWFGYGHGSNSVATVPVYGNNAHEPCYDQNSAAGSWCQQGWQWSLDKVVDPSGNVTLYNYDKQTNHYARWANPANLTSYDRASVLTDVEYGFDAAGHNHGKLVVTTAGRCRGALTDPSHDCSGDGPNLWPDTPRDLICHASDTSCDQGSPSFFSTTRYDQVISKTIAQGQSTSDANATTRTVDTWTLNQGFPDPDGTGANDPDDPDLWLKSIDRTGRAPGGGPSVTLPSVTFGSTALPNRVNTPAGQRDWAKFRVSSVLNEAGGLIKVDYGHASSDRRCTGSSLPAHRWTQGRECFAQWTALPGDGGDHWQWFHKYVVTRIALADQALGYTYPNSNPVSGMLIGSAAGLRLRVPWRPRLAVLRSRERPGHHAGWTDWRGYPTTVIHTRNTGNDLVQPGDESQKVVTRYRGMNGTQSDDTGATFTGRTVDGSDPSAPIDTQAMAGRTWMEKNRAGDGTTLSTVEHDYGFRGVSPTASDAFGNNARMVFENQEIDTTVRQGAGDLHKTTTYGYNTSPGAVSLGELTGVQTQGFDGNGSQSTTCTLTSWVTSDANWIREPTTTRTYAEDGANPEPCDSNLTNPVRRIVNHYDHDNALTDGLLTSTDTYTVNNSTYATTSYAHDSYGRVTQVTSPVGTATATAYNPGGYDGDLLTNTLTVEHATQGPNSTLATYTTLDPLRGLPVSMTDANGRTTTATRDGLGRILTVSPPNGGSITYSYDDHQNAASRVEQRVLRSGTASYNTTFTFTDGWGRTIQTQVPQVNDTTSRVASITGYDDEGLVAYQLPTVPSSNLGTLANPDPTQAAAHYTKTTYDALGRPTKVADMSDGNAWANTTTAYTANTTTLTPATGATIVTTDDAWGRPSEITQHDPVNGPITADYTYDAAGDLVTITSDVAGQPATWRYRYNLAGWRTHAVDPDTGTTITSYDPAGNPVQVTGPEGTTSTAWDGFNRPYKVYSGTDPTTNVLASYTYDGPGDNSQGRLTSVVNHTPLGDLTVTVPSYDAMGNPTGTTWTYPAALTGENSTTSGGTTASKTETYGYDLAGDRTQIHYPAAGDLAALKVNTTYQANSQPATITTNPPGTANGPSGTTLTLASYSYNNLNRATDLWSQGKTSSSSCLPSIGSDLQDHTDYTGCFGYDRRYAWDNNTGRITAITSRNWANTNPLGSPTATPLTLGYTYDDGGNPQRITQTSPAGTAAVCFGYDGANRLIHAATQLPDPDRASGCLSGGVGAVTGDDYSLDFNFTDTRLTQVASNVAGTQTGYVNYSYQEAVGNPSHRPQQTTLHGTGDPALPAAATQTYDRAGRVKTLTPDTGPATTYGYDTRGNLTATQTGGTSTTDAYNADGTRLAEQTTDGAGRRTTTLYLGDTDLTATSTGSGGGTGSSTLAAVRHFHTANATPLATQHDTNTWTWLTADTQHNIRHAWTYSGSTAQGRYLNYYPYGAPVTGPPSNDPATLPGTGHHGYLDHPTEPNGDLRLDHRTYTPTLDTLTTPDPLQTPDDPANLNPYAYARNNPVTAADPTGLLVSIHDGGGIVEPLDQPAYIPGGNGGCHGCPPAGTDLGGWGDRLAGSIHTVTSLFTTAEYGPAAPLVNPLIDNPINALLHANPDTGGYKVAGAVTQAGLFFIPGAGEEGLGVRITETADKAATDLAANTAEKVAINGETTATRLGREMHASWDYGPGFTKEFTLRGGGRVDAINFETRQVIELKPNNPRAIRLGNRQIEDYLAKLNEQFPGEPWTGSVVTYGP